MASTLIYYHLGNGEYITPRLQTTDNLPINPKAVIVLFKDCTGNLICKHTLEGCGVIKAAEHGMELMRTYKTIGRIEITPIGGMIV